MIYLLNWRMWLAAGVLALMPILYMKGRSDGTRLERAAVAASVAQADHEARATEQRRQDRVGESVGLASARERGLAADAARARGELGGLRNALDAAERAAQKSAAAADQYRTTAGELLVSCGNDLQGLAAKADGHASDVKLLLDAWPR